MAGTGLGAGSTGTGGGTVPYSPTSVNSSWLAAVQACTAIPGWTQGVIWIAFVFQGRHQRLKRHTANRAISRFVAENFGMHWAGVNRAGHIWNVRLIGSLSVLLALNR